MNIHMGSRGRRNGGWNEEAFFNDLAQSLLTTPTGMLSFVDKVENFNKRVSHEYEYIDHMLRFIPFDTYEQFTKEQWKSHNRSEYLRKEGNERYAKKKLLKALSYYTKSIAYAEHGTEDLGMGYANRSAVLFEAQYYKECLEDIERALDNRYPEDKKGKLITRREKAEKLLPTTKVYKYHDDPPEIKNKHPKIASAADCVDIAENKVFGKHVIATRDIKAGEIIMVERPYAKSVKRKVRTLHCSECIELCYNLIPCSKCAEALYCSVACKDSALEKYHRYECEVIRTNSYINCIDAREPLYLRFTIQGLEEYNTLKMPDTSDIYRSDRFKEINNLCTNIEKLSTDDWIKKAYRPALFYKALTEKTDILSKITAKANIKKRKNVLKDILLRNYQIMVTNSCGVNKYSKEKFDCPNIGAGLYSFKAMFNHACNQNVDAACYGYTVVLYAHRNIQKGEQCFVNYGNSFMSTPREVRAEKLKEFHVTCNCQACRENWVMKSNLERMDTPYPLLIIVKSMEGRFMNGHIADEDKQNFLKDCFSIVEGLQGEPEWGLNRVTLRFLIQSCIFSLSNKDIKF